MTSSKWKKYKIGELAEVKRGASPRPINNYIVKNGIPWVKIADATKSDSRYICSTNEYIKKEGVEKSVVVEPEMLVVSNSATPGLPKIMKIKACVHDGWLVFDNYKNITRDFLYYKFKDIKPRLVNQANGSVFQNLKTEIVKNFEITLPDVLTQNKIVSILSCLDDKIELNNKINENLEEFIKILYLNSIKEMKNSKSLTLDEFCNIFTGRKNANEFNENGLYKFFTCGPKVLNINSYIFEGPAVIISGNGVYTGRTMFYEGKFDLYQRTYACTIKENINKDYIYTFYTIIKNQLSKKITGGTHGSAIPYIVMNDLAKFEFIYDKDIFDKISNIIKSVMQKILKNNEETEKLKKLRDILLPKLINGAIDVDEVIEEKLCKVY